ncbi:MAG: gamma-glutamyltransferase family protein [Actinomycetota bacterium]|nr:gamma-glutamyltransferase family protein [Actinomycetota bacterium]
MPDFTTRPELTGDFGMVAATHWIATAVGMALLEQGGNAFDAAVGAGFTMQVVEPHLCGPAGEAPIVVHHAGTDETSVIAGQGPAPAKATISHFDDLGLSLVPGTGPLAACVPGAFDAWMTLLDRFATMTVAEVIEPAIGYATRGFTVHDRMAGAIAAVADMFRNDWLTSAAVYLPHGAVPAAGARFANRALAATYQRIVAAASEAGDRSAGIAAARATFSRDFVADAIDRFCRTEHADSSGGPHAGLLDGADLAAWSTPVEPPLWFDYGPYRLAKTGPWGQGPVMLQQLALLAGFDLGDTGACDPDLVHTVVECAKLAFADREAWYGDPSVVDVPIGALLSGEYNDRRRALIRPDADDALRPGSPDGRTPHLPQGLTVTDREHGDVGVGEPTVARSGMTRGDTCHVDVVDRWGNMVSATPSGGWLQSSPVIPELGFCLGTRAQMFWLEPGLPASLAPGKRPRTTLSPSLALRDGAPYLAFGTPGGDQQDQWSLNFLLRHVHHGLNLQESIDAPTWHSNHMPSSFYPRRRSPREVVVEDRLGSATIEALRRRGHQVTVSGPWSLGRLSAVSRGDDGFLRAGANPRDMQGYAAGR